MTTSGYLARVRFVTPHCFQRLVLGVCQDDDINNTNRSKGTTKGGDATV